MDGEGARYSSLIKRYPRKRAREGRVRKELQFVTLQRKGKGDLLAKKRA